MQQASSLKLKHYVRVLATALLIWVTQDKKQFKFSNMAAN